MQHHDSRPTIPKTSSAHPSHESRPGTARTVELKDVESDAFVASSNLMSADEGTA